MRSVTHFSVLAAVLLAASCPSWAQRSGPRLQRLEQRAKDLQRRIDDELRYMFQAQVQAAVYRSRLSSLQQEWQKLFTAIGARPKLSTPRPPPPNELRIEEVVASDAQSLEQALATPSCKRRKDCRIWARISFGRELVKSGSKFEFSADLVNRSGSKRAAIPAKSLTVNQPIMVVDLPLSGTLIYKDHYKGTLRVLCEGRYKSKPFEFQLIKTY
jgi:hypothetical protein